MSQLSQLVDNAVVEARLVKLRDVPEAAPSEDVLTLFCSYLLGEPPKSSQASIQVSRRFEHWFCSRADPLTVEVATFLIRLHAYNSSRVDIWRQQLRVILASCCGCIRGLQQAKVTSRHTYFDAFPDDILKGFYDNFVKWELQSVVRGLSEARILQNGAPASDRTLSDAPPAVLFHALSNLNILQDPRILNVMQSNVPLTPIPSWPTDIPPAGLFLVLMHEQPETRNWAREQLSLYQTTPLSKDQFFETFHTVFSAVTKLVMSESSAGANPIQFPFAKDLISRWSGYCTALRFVPAEFLRSGKTFGVDLRLVVIGHLHDTGNHFIDVLKSFVLILTTAGPATWDGEGPEYPHVILMSIKDNTKYLELLAGLRADRKDHWLLSWVQTYIKTIAALPTFKDIFPTVIHFLCEELQHERFQEVRPAAMTIASRLILTVLQADGNGALRPHQTVAWEIMDVHASAFISVAFAKTHVDDKWVEARTCARKLIKQVLISDIDNISTVISRLCGSASDAESISPTVIHVPIWKEMYETIQPSDSDSISMIVTILVRIAHFDELKETAFAEKIRVSSNPDAFRIALKSVNQALLAVCSGFGDITTRYLDFTLPTFIVDFLRSPDIVKFVTILMFSPLETLQESAQALAGSAFDVEVRLDCFRSLLEKFPDATLNGIFYHLETFHRFTQVAPEACGLSKALARCLTDVIDVLCSSPGGLLHNEQFLQADRREPLPAQLLKWWNLMTKALSDIFLRTPRWAVYFENTDMVLWMRDALIFGRDMLAQRKVIEAGAFANSQQAKEAGKRKLSRVGRKMVDDLQQVLLELARWLRLTDEELLHQSFALLEALLACFQETDIPPAPTALQKLQKQIDDSRKKVPNRPQTRLDAARIARLQDAVSSFDDDEVQIISHTFREPKPMPKPEQKSAESSKAAVSKGKAPAVASTRKVTTEERQQTKTTLDRKARENDTFSTSENRRKPVGDTSFPQMKRPTTSTKDAVLPEVRARGDSASVKSAATSAAESSSSSEGSDEEGTGLASLTKMQRTPKVKKPAERRQVMRLDMPATKNPALERIQKREEARRTQLRLKPDISGLHRAILSWDYNHTGPDPPGEQLRFSSVPPRFSDPQHFRRIFEPMLLSECWVQLLESKEEVRDTYDCHIASRQFNDDWLDLEISIDGGLKKDWILSDSDLVLLRHPGNNKCVLAKVQSFRTSRFGAQGTIRCFSRNDPGLEMSSVWLMSKVLNLTTLHREYGALMALPYYDFCDQIMQGKIARLAVPDSKQIHATMATYNVNEPQARAILSALQGSGFALIQGPPGTGKTSTICGLVHAFLSRRPRPATAIHAGRNAGASDKECVRKVLLCAPSNAAIDEIAFRLKEGVSGAGRATSPKVVRVGAVNSMNVSVRDISLEQLIEAKLNASPEMQKVGGDGGGEIARLGAELEVVKRTRQQKLEEMTNIHDNAAKTIALEEEVKKLGKQKALLAHEFNKLKDKRISDSRTLDSTRRRCRAEVLLEVDVVCSTLSGASYEYLDACDFDLIIIDEAAQAIELSSLIPMKFKCNRCVMVGDPQQLPPTVKSQESTKYGYNQSLFVRLQQQNPDAVQLLSIQYRMHPDISRLPSRLFYNGRLQDGPDMATKTSRPWHPHVKLGTYKFFNVSAGREESARGHSLVNRAEAQIAVALFHRLRLDFSTFDFDFKVGIISMYRGQILELRRAFEQRFGADISAIVDFNTVDGFQGQEKDIIILSCVRAGPGIQSVGFLRDVRRMNVALTRAKASLFVLGHAPTLERSDDTWRGIVEDARARACFTDVDATFFTSPLVSTRGATVPAKPAKPRSKIEAPSVPTNLLTPRELKALANSTSLAPTVAASGIDASPVASSSKIPPSDVALPSTVSDTQQIAAPLPPLQANESAQPKPRPRPPPVRRPKPPPTLFIPKKRPAPDGGESGPNGTRRRL